MKFDAENVVPVENGVTSNYWFFIVDWRKKGRASYYNSFVSSTGEGHLISSHIINTNRDQAVAERCAFSFT
jgi:hypothetical protein